MRQALCRAAIIAQGLPAFALRLSLHAAALRAQDLATSRSKQ